jgi:methyl-accepting chemotaxis protein
MRLADCASDLLDLKQGARYYTEDDQQWREVVSLMAGGERIIARRVLYNGEPSMLIGTTEIRGSLPFLIFSSVVGMLVALPFALVLAWLLVRLQTRRLARLAGVSRRFARGEFSARVLSHRRDMIGALSQQFDSMADALQRNMDDLRTLAGRHRDLAKQAEQAAGAAERARVARDLHDTLAQQIFNLAVTASALGDSADQHSPQNVEVAHQLAQRAEDTLLHLRGVLVDLRAGKEEQP